MPDGIKTTYKITGTTDLAGFLADLKPSTQSRIIAGAVMAGSKPIVTLAKSKVRKRSGALAKALGSITRRYPAQGRVVAFIGARKGKYKVSSTPRGGQKSRRAKKGEKGSFVVPSSYSHLVERGHRIAKGGSLRDKHETVVNVVNGKRRRRKTDKVIQKATGTVGGYVPAFPFLDPAFVAGKAEAERIIKSEGFNKALEAEYKRAQRKFNKPIVIKS